VTLPELREEIALELGHIETTVAEALSLRDDVGARDASNREKTAAAAFLAQFYGGTQNILKRLCRYHGVPLPFGDTWHIDLFQRFCAPAAAPLPVLFDAILAPAFSGYRKFRHVVHHGYGFQLDWPRILEGLDRLDEAFRGFRDRLERYLHDLDQGK
jgi:hypothetical protein